MTTTPAERQPEDGDELQLDVDLDRMWRKAGRAPIGLGTAVGGGAGALIGIDMKYDSKPTTLAFVAASVITIFVGLALVLLGINVRRSMRAYAHEWQVLRKKAAGFDDLERERDALKLERDALRSRVAELEQALAGRSRRRDPGRSTGRGRALTPVDLERGSP